MKMREITTALDQTMAELLRLVASLDDEQINAVPFEGSWSAGQLARHLVLSNAGFIEVINGPVQDTERAPDERVEQLRAGFLNFDTRVEAADFLNPPAIRYDKAELLRSLEDIRSELREVAETLDLAPTCRAFELPVYGYLTRLEALAFVLFHTQRHIHQLKRIIENVVNLA